MSEKDKVLLKRIVEETVYKMLTENNLLVMEMSVPRKEFKRKVDSLLNQIAENWCLVRYCSYEGGNKDNINHWKIELRAHLVTIARNKISADNKFKTRYNALKETIMTENEFNDVENVEYRVSTKFMEEGLDYNGQKFKDVCSEFVDDLEMLIRVLAKGDIGEIQAYINTIG